MNTKRLVQIMLIFLFLYTFHITLYTNISFAASKGNPPVGHWKFDEGGGPTAYDESTNNNDGTLGGNATFGNGKIGKAASFDGSGDYVLIPASGTFDVTDLTISCWTYSTNYDANMFMFEKTTNGSVNTQYSLFFNNGGAESQIYFRTYGLSTTDLSVTDHAKGPVDGQWNFIAATYNSATDVKKIYCNGQEIASASGITGTIVTNPAGTSWIGAYGGGSGYPFNGKIDDMRVYNYSRTPEQVLIDYNAGWAAHLGAGADPNEGNPPVGYWPMDENTGQYAYDRSGSGNNGTFNGDAAWTSGKYGSAVSFDGNGDWVSIPDSASLDTISAAGSVEAWIYITSLPSNGSSDSNLAAIATGHTSAYFEVYNYSALTTYPRLGLWRSSPTSLWTLGATDLRGKTGQWLHAACTWDSSGAKIYLNGQLDGSDANGGVAGVVGASGFGIGRNPIVTRYLNGKIDEVKVYNYARTPAQIAYDYNRGKPVAHYRFDEGAGTIAHNEYSTADTGVAPVGWWRMDEGTGTSAADSSGNSYTGTLTAGATWSNSAKIGPNALSLDGVDDYVTMGDINAADAGPGQSLTVQAWVKTTDPSGDVVTKYGLSGSTPTWNMDIRSNVYSAWIRDTGGTEFSVSSNATVNDNNWHHLVFVRDKSAGKVYVYVDGVLKNSATDTTNDCSNAQPVLIGRRLSGAAECLAGLVDDVRIYNYARTAEQIYNDYKTTHGTLVGNAKFADGKINKALTFDGAGDYVDVPDSNEARPAKAVTLSCWVKHSSVALAVYMAKQVGTGSSNSYALWYNGDNTLRGCAGDSSGVDQITYTWTPAAGQWYHLAYTFDDDANTEKLFVDGREAASDSNSKTMGYNDSPVTISYDFNGPNRTSGGYGINGLIDDARIYSYARTAEQILQDYNAGVAARVGAQSVGEADPWGGALPVAYWKFDENTGVVAQDASGNNLNGSLIGSPAWTNGKNGPAILFDGQNDYITVSDNSLLQIPGDLTITFWMRKDAEASDWTRLVGKGASTPRNYGIWEEFGAGKKLLWQQYNSSGTSVCQFYSIRNIEIGQWYFVTAVVSGSAGYLYINGVFDSSGAKSGTPATSSDPATIGYAGFHTYFPGIIDDVKIYNYARTAAQIAWDYNRGKPVGHWRFNEGSGTTAYDESDNNNDGTITIGATGSQTSIASAWTNGATGKFGKCMSFDGTDDYTNVPDASSLDFGTRDFSVEAWVYANSAGLSQNVEYGLINKNATFQGSAGWGIEFSTWGRSSPFATIGISSYITSQSAWGNTGAGASLATNQWNHIAMTRASGTLTFYLNGAVTGTITHADVGLTVDNAQPIVIGDHSWGPNFSGKVDDVRVYNYARTAEQILQDYNNGMGARLGD